MLARAETLFHFTRNIDSIKSILTKGFLPSYSAEDSSWLGIEHLSLIARPMVCFCDIPLSRIASHTDFYGQFGIGLSKAWGVASGLAPITYTPEQSAFTHVAHFLKSLELKLENRATEIAEQSHALYEMYAALLKPIRGMMVRRDALLDKDFHQENEWRFILPDLPTYPYEEFRDVRESANLAANQRPLRFPLSEVRYLFTEYEHEVLDLVQFIQWQLPGTERSDRQLLTTKVFSLERLKRDM